MYNKYSKSPHSSARICKDINIMEEIMVFEREFAEWNDFWWEKAGDFSCTRILLIGDSITKSYRRRVQEIFRPERIAVDQLCGSRCAGDPVLTAELDLATGPLTGYRYDIIHFNNGLHGGCNDTHIPLSVYEKGIADIISVLRNNQPEAKLILATTTPMVKADNPAAGDFVRERNAFLRRFAKENCFSINDLYALTADSSAFPQTDTVHFEKSAAEKLGDHVAEYIRKFL